MECVLIPQGPSDVNWLMFLDTICQITLSHLSFIFRSHWAISILYSWGSISLMKNMPESRVIYNKRWLLQALWTERWLGGHFFSQMEEIKSLRPWCEGFNSKLKKQLNTLQNLLASVYNQLESSQGTLGRGGGLDCCCENLVHRVLILQQVLPNSPIYRECDSGLSKGLE